MKNLIILCLSLKKHSIHFLLCIGLYDANKKSKEDKKDPKFSTNEVLLHSGQKRKNLFRFKIILSVINF
ncbi:hypothetical protein BWK63_02755 [Flavobacterium covae]|nr:hypothetical protein BWK63_02755 [Flavobacterium covae]